MPANLQALLAQLQQQAQPKKPLVEFKAGILTISGTTVTADERRGKLSLVQGDDQLLHLLWKTRPQDTTEIDLIVMPQSATVEKIPECTTGRVLYLKFKNSTNRRFFWMQEPKEDEDDKLVKQLNDYIANPPRPGAGEEGMMGDDEQMEQAALMSMFGAGAGAAGMPQTPGGSFPPASFVTPPARPTATAPPTRVAPRPVTTTIVAPPSAPLVAAVGGPTSAPIFPNPSPPTPATIATTVTSAAPIVPQTATATSSSAAATTANTTVAASTTSTASTASSGTTSSGTTGSTTTSTPRSTTTTTTSAAAPNSFAATLTAMAEQLAAQQHSLENILEADRVLPQLEQKDIASLLEFLPEGQRTPHDLEQTLRSPQLQQTLQNLSQILNSRQFGALMASLGLPTSGSMGVLPFCEAIQKKADDDKKKQSGDKK